MKQIKLLLVLATVALVTWFTDNQAVYEEEVHFVRLHPGQTVEEVSEPFYDFNEDGASYMLFRHRVRERNKILFDEGRIPQVNDLVIIPVMRKK